jgi:disulfide bond formation protein DsbB
MLTIHSSSAFDMFTRLYSLWPCLVAGGQILAVCGVLCGSLGYQFSLGELPCPLCVLQRLSFLLACVGSLGVLRSAGASDGGIARQVRGFAWCIFASFVGAAVSIRQILLHIVPPDLGYGPPVLGLHLYSWALIVFCCLILSSALGLLGVSDQPRAFPSVITNRIGALVIVIGAVIALATFAMQGFNTFLPGDPQNYELFRQVGFQR